MLEQMEPTPESFHPEPPAALIINKQTAAMYAEAAFRRYDELIETDPKRAYQCLDLFVALSHRVLDSTSLQRVSPELLAELQPHVNVDETTDPRNHI